MSEFERGVKAAAEAIRGIDVMPPAMFAYNAWSAAMLMRELAAMRAESLTEDNAR